MSLTDFQYADAEKRDKRLKLLLLYDYMRQTDENHMVSITRDIIPFLKENGIGATKQTIYADFNQLRDYASIIGDTKEGTGFTIEKRPTGKDCLYFMKKGVMDFEPGELKLLLDAAQCSKVISQKQSRTLVKKIEALASEADRKQLHGQVFIDDRLKADSEDIFPVVNTLHKAISNNHQIRFHYTQWNMSKSLEDKNQGYWYQVSPLGLVLDTENYYLVAYYDPEDQENPARKGKDKPGLRNYRVDKILGDIEELSTKRARNDDVRKFNITAYSKQVFGMYGGEPANVILEVRNSLIGVMIDRFGKKNIMPIPCQDGEHFRIQVSVRVSPQFLAWIFGLGTGAKIVFPPSAVDKMKEMVSSAAEMYT